MGPESGAREPGWYADPTARHEQRYWDGQRWTDTVVDGRDRSTDTITDPAELAARPSGPRREPAGPPPAQAARRRRAIVGVTLAALLLGAGIAVAVTLAVSGGGDDAPPGVLEGADAIGVHRIELEAGDAARFRVVPTAPEADLVVGIGTSADVATAAMLANPDLFDFADLADPSLETIRDYFGITVEFGREYEEALDGIVDVVIGERDRTGTDDGEADWFVALAPGEYVVLVAEAYGADAAYDIELGVERGAFVPDEGDNPTAPRDLGAAFFTDPAFYEDGLLDRF